MDNFIYEEDLDHFNAESERQFALGEEAEAWAKSKAAHIKNLEAEIAGVKSVVDPLLARLDKLNDSLDKTRSSLAQLMESANIKKIKDSRFIINLGNSEYVKVADKSSLPKEYIRTTTAITPDLQAIRLDLSRGKKIEGCSIETRSYVTIK